VSQSAACAKREEGCTATVAGHKWAKIRATSEGWFFSQQGEAFCPQHLPDWVGPWRARQAAAVTTESAWLPATAACTQGDWSESAQGDSEEAFTAVYDQARGHVAATKHQVTIIKTKTLTLEPGSKAANLS
jgi:predicted component of type VI protein secretion system